MQGDVHIDLTREEVPQPPESQGSKEPRPEPRDQEGVQAPAEADEGSQEGGTQEEEEEEEEHSPEGNSGEDEKALEEELRVASPSLGGQRNETKPKQPRGGKRGLDQQTGDNPTKRHRTKKPVVLRRPSGSQPSRPAPPPAGPGPAPSEKKCRVVHRHGVSAYLMCMDKYAGGLSAKRHPEYLSKVSWEPV